MRTAYTREWCLKRAQMEGSGHVGCGILALMPTTQGEAESCSSDCDHSRIAFGRLIQLSRRKERLSIEEFARKADIEIADLCNIERTGCVQEPRTVYQLSRTLKIEPKKLLQLSGLTKEREPELEQEAVLFAARSESLEKLTAEETYALEHFISVLSEKR